MNIGFESDVIPLNGGLFVSKGVGTHPVRVLDSHEIIFVTAGALGIFEDDSRYVLRPGDCLLLESGRRHGGKMDYPQDLSFYWIHFKLADHEKREPPLLRVPKTVTLPRPQLGTEHFRRFLDNQENMSGSDPILAKLALLSILRMMELAATIGVDSTKQRALAEKVRQYLDIHFASATSTAKVAEALGVNPDYMGRVFKAATGGSVTRGIHARRVAKAKRLLLDNQLNVSEIAYDCGYNDLPHFRRMFKRHVGMLPSEYRNTHLRVHMNSE